MGNFSWNSSCHAHLVLSVWSTGPTNNNVFPLFPALCPGQFGCPNGLCLPFERVCDGNADCPWAEDELVCVERGNCRPDQFRYCIVAIASFPGFPDELL